MVVRLNDPSVAAHHREQRDRFRRGEGDVAAGGGAGCRPSLPRLPSCGPSGTLPSRMPPEGVRIDRPREPERLGALAGPGARLPVCRIVLGVVAVPLVVARALRRRGNLADRRYQRVRLGAAPCGRDGRPVGEIRSCTRSGGHNQGRAATGSAGPGGSASPSAPGPSCTGSAQAATFRPVASGRDASHASRSLSRQRTARCPTRRGSGKSPSPHQPVDGRTTQAGALLYLFATQHAVNRQHVTNPPNSFRLRDRKSGNSDCQTMCYDAFSRYCSSAVQVPQTHLLATHATFANDCAGPVRGDVLDRVGEDRPPLEAVRRPASRPGAIRRDVVGLTPQAWSRTTVPRAARGRTRPSAASARAACRGDRSARRPVRPAIRWRVPARVP